jgi:molecular chaperone DnaK
MNPCIGIDLGTTNSVVAWLDQSSPRAIPIDGRLTLPSVVSFEESRVVVGQQARNLELLQPGRTIRSVKRRMGTSHQYAVGGRLLSPEEVSAEILAALKRGAEQALGESVRDVVITVPAYFDDAQRRATLKAGELAGLNVLRLLNEPTSAALCYDRLGIDGSAQPELIVVYDLGGGTFDVSVLEVFRGAREVRATLGNPRLGGDDFDDKLTTAFVDQLKREQGVDVREDAQAMARLQRAAEQAKIALSADTRVLLREEFITRASGKNVHFEREVTRRELEAWIDPFIESTLELTRRAIRDAGVRPDELSCICLVGGSTRIPYVRARLEEAFQLPIHEEIDPDLAVGLGACIQAALLEERIVDRVLVDVAAHSLGIRVLGDRDSLDAPPDTFAPILPRNTVLPATRVEEFYTLVDDQEMLQVEVFQGEQPRASENTAVGSFSAALEARPEGSPVRVAFSYDLDGVVKVSVSQPGVAGEHAVALDVADASPGRAAPAAPVERRAQALLETLSGKARGELEALLANFQHARGVEREQMEESLLDFLLDHEAHEDGDG